MSILNRPVTRAAYVVVLSKDDPSPLAPESDDEKEKKDGRREEGEGQEGRAPRSRRRSKIDLEDIDQRTLALPVPPKNYVGLLAGKAGTIFLVEGPAVVARRRAGDGGPPPRTVHRFDLAKRKAEKLAGRGARVRRVRTTARRCSTGTKDDWFLVGTGAPAKPGDGALKLDGLEVRVDPRAEWKQIYREVWRIQRDFLYDPGFHGFDLKAAGTKYEPYLDGLGSRHDLNYLFDEMLGELSLEHVYLSGGDVPRAESRKSGLLGADYAVENGRYRIAKVYRGESWNPGLRAPLTQPGAGVKEGEYLLAVNGQELRGDGRGLPARSRGRPASRRCSRSGRSPDGKDSREVTVVPVANERQLRNLAWVDANRREVDKLTGGKVAYVYLPDTSAEGYTRFNRYFFAQVGSEAVIVDERFNGGGLLADHVIDYLRQPVRNYATTRRGGRPAVPDVGDPRAEGDDHQRAGRLRRRLPAVRLPAGGARAAGRQADLGRAGRHRRLPAADRRRRRDGPALGDLVPERQVGRGEPRRGPGRRGRVRPEGWSGRARTRSWRRRSRSCWRS